MRMRQLLAALALTATAFWAAPVLADDAKPKAVTKADEDEKEEKKEKPTIAHIRLSGDLDEGPIAEGPFGAAGENLSMKLERIKKAAKDPNVKALLLEVDGLRLGLFGFGKVEEVRHAIAGFRATGKKTYAYIEAIGGIEYLIALACDEVCMPESGSFEFLGLRIEMSFYKELLEKVGVKADFLTMGEAKGAAEPYTRTEMSPENRKQYQLVLDDLYEKGVIGTMIASRPERKWTTDSVKKLIDEAPYAARKAKELGLIDRIGYRTAIENDIKAGLKLDQVEVVKDYGKVVAKMDDNPFSALMKLMNPAKKSTSKKPKIAVIYAIGGIEHGKGGGSLFGGDSVGSTTMVEAIKQAEKDDTVKAIVLRVDSPGGSALASDLIWHELSKSKKPTIASMGDVAASGGYYISMGCSKVYAEPGTLTGSIGVVGGKLATGGLEEWAGIRTQVLAHGKNSGAGSSTFVFSKSERDAISGLMQDIYDQFLSRTIDNRKKAGVDFTREKLLPLAGGRIWTGRQAKDLGLIDQLGTLADALAEAKARGKFEKNVEPELLILPEPVSFLDRLMEGDVDFPIRSTVLQRMPELQALPEGRAHLRSLEALLKLRKDRVWMTMPHGVRVK